MPLSFSIVINTLDRASVLRTALQSLRHLRRSDFEVIVVNGPSQDNTDDVIRSFPDVKALTCPAANLSQSRNIGIRAAAGDIVCFLDDDAVPEPTWLDRLEPLYANERVGAVGGFIRDHTGVAFQCRAIVCDRMGDARDHESEAEANCRSEPGAWSFLSPTGANSSFRRSALLDIGGFDEEFAYFLDETDVNLRLVDAGWEIRFAEGAEVHHKYAPSALRDHRRVPQRLFNQFRSKAYFVCRHARGEGRKTLNEIFDYLAAHKIEIRRHNRWYLENKWIDQAHFDRLEHDMDTGLREGVRDAFSVFAPRTMRPDSITPPPAFRRFPIGRSASDRLRLAFLSQDYPPGATGGIGVWTHTLARAMAADGHEVSVVTRAASEHATVDYEDGVWVHRIVQRWQPHRTDPPLDNLPQTIKDYCYSAFDEIVRIHQLRGLDFVSWPIWDVEGAAVASSGLIPNAMSLHTSYKLALPSKPDWTGNPEYRENHVDKVIAHETLMLSKAPHILGNSAAIVRDMEDVYGVRLPPSRLVVAPHGVEDVSPWFRRSRGDDGLVQLLFVGRMEPRKGADVLLQALPALLEQESQLAVRFIGRDDIEIDGESLRRGFERRWASQRWMERVTFEGELDRDALMQAYCDCDIFAAPSRYESFGLVAVEAMAFGRPVVAVDTGGLAEVVVHEGTGLLAQPGDPVSLAEHIRRLVRDPTLRTQMGRAGRARYDALYSVPAMRDAVAGIFRGWIEGRKARFQAA